MQEGELTEVRVLRHALDAGVPLRDVQIAARHASGTPIDHDLIEQLTDDAETGHDVDEIIARRGTRGRPPLGSAPSTVEAVRLDPERSSGRLRT